MEQAIQIEPEDAPRPIIATVTIDADGGAVVTGGVNLAANRQVIEKGLRQAQDWLTTVD